MNDIYQNSTVAQQESVLATNSVIRNTYMLLSMTLVFSAACAGIAMKMNMPFLNPFIVLGGYFALLFATAKTRNSPLGIVFVFALTGFMGATLGPLINAYIQGFSNGAEIVMLALGGTGAIFLGLSAYALTTRKDFSFMGGFLMGGIMVAFFCGIAGLLGSQFGWFDAQPLMLAVSGMFMLLMCGLILYETSQIIHGGETNYIMATVTLYISIYNLFTSLLHLLGFAMGDD